MVELTVMRPRKKTVPRQYRVWIVRYRDRPPQDPDDVPPHYWALEPAEDGAMSARKANAYKEAFNRTILARSRKVWAVAVPVTVRYEGDLQPGQRETEEEKERRGEREPRRRT